MPKIVPISAKKMMKILLRLGFVILRSKGSHHFFINKLNNKTTVVPVHGNEDLGVGIIKEILRDIELSAEAYDRWRKEV